ncbi:hypothetical protein AB0F72_08400 [Actinoplanes sp. NPDC023936]|uniref:hypothetical protein n=1 Tax=Actinoplanes sp. NPDC023936 TaxID=3154910 RepID=UPI0033F61E47
MSHIGDLIIAHGPLQPGDPDPLHNLTIGDFNALRDELIELRAAVVPTPEGCQEETYSWEHFTPHQTDGFWIRCTLTGPHDEHRDGHTGLTWKTNAEGTP